MATRVRFRFRLQKTLNLNETEHELTLGGRKAVLAPQLPNTPIRESEWLVLNIREFSSASDAIEYARRLKKAVQVSSVSARLGVDTGLDQPTCGFGQMVKDAVKSSEGIVLRDNVHGLDIFDDDPNIRFAHFTGTGKVLAAPDPFLEDIESFLGVVDQLTPRGIDILLLLNYALMRTDPVAAVIFAISAVDALGQAETWTSAQRALLRELAGAAEISPACSVEERAEVAAAIRRGTQKLSLRQGVMRLLDREGLTHLKDHWDALYARRSTLVHGLAPRPGADYGPLAQDAINLCGRILLSTLERETPGATRHLDRLYPLPTAPTDK